MAFNFELFKSYNFSTLAPNILGNEFKNAKVIGIIDYATASGYINPDSYSANIYPYLPTGTLRDAKMYTYILFVSEIGIKTVLAWQWIDPTSIEEVISRSLSITVNDVSVGDSERVRDALLSLGLNKFNITTI